MKAFIFLANFFYLVLAHGQSLPPPRYSFALAFDDARGKLVMFGGSNKGTFMNDTWEWNGAKWMQINSTGGPDARFLHASTYDEKNKKVLIFGGNSFVGPPTQESIKGDLWAWDGVKWEQCKGDGPSPRDHVDMVYDPSKKKLIVHGGGKADGNSASDTWEWDGKIWSSRVATSTAPLEGYKLAYDLKNETVLLFGGFIGGAPSSSLWKLSGSEWSLVK